MKTERGIPRGYARVLVMAARPHFFAFPMGAVLAGAASQMQATSPASAALAASAALGGTQQPVSVLRLSLALLAAGLGWGVGQLLNDVLDREADAVDAPDRPAVRGLLPARPTVIVAFAVGLFVAGIVVVLHPRGWLLGACAMVLIASYNLFKRVPWLGNVSHGLVMSLACLIGAAAVSPRAGLFTIISSAWLPLLLTFLWAGLYLAANYEKDRRGDAAAGYFTSAHVLGVRGSALARGLGALLIGGGGVVAIDHGYSRAGLLVAVLLVMSSVVTTWRGADEGAALRGYRAAVHGGAVGMLSLGAGVLPPWVFALFLTISVALTEAAFRRTDNP